MLMNIHKGSIPDSSSTTYPMGATLSDILFSFALEKYIVCDVCGLRSPSFESSSVLYISPNCNRNCTNPVLDLTRTLGTSNQAIYYNLLYICFSSLIDLDTLTIISPKIDMPYLWIRTLGLVPFNLAYSCYWSSWTIYTFRSLYCIYQLLQKTFYCNDNTITEFGNIAQEGGSLIAPMALAHPLHPIDNRSRNRRRNLWVGWCVSFWWPLFPPRSSVLIHICILYRSSVIGCIHTYNRSVIQYWWSCTPSHSVGLYFWGVRGSWVECHVCFLWFTNCVLLSDK